MGVYPVLEKLAEIAGIPNQVLVGKLIVGGSTVNRVWEESAVKPEVRTVLKAGRVDILTMAPHRLLPDPGIDKFVDLGLAGNPHLRFTIQQSWMPFDNGIDPGADPDPAQKRPTDWDAMTGAKLLALSANYFKEIDKQVGAVNQRAGHPVAFLVPIGPAVTALREKVRLGQVPGIHTQAALFRDRMGHPGSAINLLNAYCHFIVIYRRSPVGLKTPIPLPEIPAGDSDALNRLLQTIAWETVTATPLSGVAADQSPSDGSKHQLSP